MGFKSIWMMIFGYGRWGFTHKIYKNQNKKNKVGFKIISSYSSLVFSSLFSFLFLFSSPYPLLLPIFLVLSSPSPSYLSLPPLLRIYLFLSSSSHSCVSVKPL